MPVHKRARGWTSLDHPVSTAAALPGRSCEDQDSIIKRRKVAHALSGSKGQAEQHRIGTLVVEQGVEGHGQDGGVAVFQRGATESREQAATACSNAFNRQPVVLKAPVRKGRERRLCGDDVPELVRAPDRGSTSIPTGTDAYDLAAGHDPRLDPVRMLFRFELVRLVAGMPVRADHVVKSVRIYDLPFSGDFSPGRGGLLQLLGMSLPRCCRFHPAEVKVPRRPDFGTPCCLRPSVAGSAFGSPLSRPLTRSLLLQPGDLCPPPGRPCR